MSRISLLGLVLYVTVVLACEAQSQVAATSSSGQQSPQITPTDAVAPTATTTVQASPTAGLTYVPTPTPSPGPIQAPIPSPAVTHTATLTPRTPVFSSAKETAQVVNVVDGDTIDVLIEGRQYRVRYIGVDTPETVHPTRGVEPYGPEAAANKNLVDGKTVYLEKDVSEADQYGRLLRYVWLGDGTLVNELLVVQGFAQVSTYPPDVKYQERFLKAQTQARESGAGLWKSSGAPLSPSPTAESASGGNRSNCDSAYPTVCIPSPPPDLDCGEIRYRRFKVLPPDPHRFDGDRDGVGCES